MRKTKKEKLAAALRRQREFERISQVLTESLTKFEKENQKEAVPQTTIPAETSQAKVSQHLLDLSYLPKQLVKIGAITFSLVLAQLIISFIL